MVGELDVQASSQNAIRGLQDELIACQRQMLLGSVAGLMAHEFNNLMTPVLARAQDAVERDDVPAMRKALTVTVGQTQKAIEITRRLLELATGGAMAARPCGVRAAVEDALAAAVRPFAKDGIELTVDVADELMVKAEPVLLTQALANLLMYARANIGERSGRIAIRAERQDGFVRIEIADSGSASRERIESVIGPFVAADVRETPGDPQHVGLVLNVCRTIIQFQGGRMEAHPAEGTGCVFTLRWPSL